jgi:hypothetical protein
MFCRRRGTRIEEEESRSFLKKRTKKTLPVAIGIRAARLNGLPDARAKVFCFFFSKKKAFSSVSTIATGTSNFPTVQLRAPRRAAIMHNKAIGSLILRARICVMRRLGDVLAILSHRSTVLSIILT